MEGEEVIPFIYSNAKSFSNGLAFVQAMNDDWGYIDVNGIEYWA